MAKKSETGPKQDSVTLGSLKGAEYNPRTISPIEFDKLKRSLREFGFVEPIVVRRDGLIIGGHQRVAAFRSNLEEDGLSKPKVDASKVPAMVVDLDETKTKLLNLALNRIVGSWDHEKLAVMFEDLGHDWSEDIHGLAGFEARELEDIIAFAADAGEIDDRSEKARVGAEPVEIPGAPQSTYIECPHCGGDVRVGVA